MALSLFTDGLFADPYLTGLERELSRAFSPYLSTRQGQQQQQVQPSSGGTLTLPRMHPMDIVEKPDRYSIVADAPGMAPDDVRIEFLNGTLVVSGEKKAQAKKTEDAGAGVKVHRSERTAASFSRSFTLPEDAKEEGIAASLVNGVLTVDVPKMAKPAKAEPKRIKVSAA